MKARDKLTLNRADTAGAVDPRKNWGVSAARSERLRNHARQMRRNPTEPEIALWEELRGQKLGGFKFQRKQVVGSTIADFACPSRWLIVEVDGDAHDTPAVDALRDRKLADVGLRVLRFASEEVMGNIEDVCEAILAELQKPFEEPRSQARRVLSKEEENAPNH